MALIFHSGGRGKEIEQPRQLKRWNFLLITGGALIYFLVAFWGSLGSLSIAEQSRRFGWEQNFGLYQSEIDERGMRFNWTGKEAGLSIPIQGDSLIIPVKASHPLIQKYPVEISVFGANAYFRKGDLITASRIDQNDWLELDIPIQQISQGWMNLVLEPSRVWRPSDHGNMNDPRMLGIGLGQ